MGTSEKTDVATPLNIIALKTHVTQLAVNQAEMARLSRLKLRKWLLSRLKLLKIALKTQVTQMVKLLATQAKKILLTINTDGAVRSDVVSCTTCKKNGHTSVKCWFGAETKLRNVVKQLAEAEMILKTEKYRKVQQPKRGPLLLLNRMPTGTIVASAIL